MADKGIPQHARPFAALSDNIDRQTLHQNPLRYGLRYAYVIGQTNKVNNPFKIGHFASYQYARLYLRDDRKMPHGLTT